MPRKIPPRPRPQFAPLGPPPDGSDGRNWIPGDWYNDPTIPIPWSTDWEYWDGLRLYAQKVDGVPKIEKLFKEVFNVPGTIEPLAYHSCAGEDFFLFTAGGRYYHWSDGYLTVHSKEFASPKAFLACCLREGGNYMPDVNVEMRPGTNLDWW
ncbi:hypothetical protein K438DRAFT_2023640 [Mycena galopus ATCC 62051]|nr:hypothetical protein K438DRAFT_2023640 [Mycena galopus ATCC 62051]